ncbi:HAD family hydrolase [Streptomyces sp. CMB-StM0423]|uniref:HAD family hydrolase n=1 Tax=Streptomyces sp. CMB-StM0423 TaxID=2059884 RepID=UPI001F414893|nr:HAD family hydrolase [Streptomyces sp. CMB-StM0423]
MVSRAVSPPALRAVLFDSGGVLMRPVGGRWNPRADFEQTVLAHAPSLTAQEFAAAIAAGDRFFAASSPTPDPDDYHRAVLRHLGVAPTAQLLADLRRDVHPSALLETYPDVERTLVELSRRGVRMAVVSDAWPNLPALHAGLGIGRFFEVYAISAVLGCNKPDPRMYRHASTALGLPPGECVPVRGRRPGAGRRGDPARVRGTCAVPGRDRLGCARRQLPDGTAGSLLTPRGGPATELPPPGPSPFPT